MTMYYGNHDAPTRAGRLMDWLFGGTVIGVGILLGLSLGGVI